MPPSIQSTPIFPFRIALHPLLPALMTALLLTTSPATNAKEISQTRKTFESGGRQIKVDVFAPTSPGPHRQVIVLPGAGGMLFDGPLVKRVARALAKNGCAAHVVNYFNRTSTLVAPNDAAMIENFSTWMETVNDAANWLAGSNEAPGSIGIYGYSLGGFLAVAVGSMNSNVGAVVEQSGGIWDKFHDPKQPLPPVLVIHGKKDERVWFEKNTERMKRYVERDGGKFYALFFEEEPHRFSDAAMNKVTEAAGEFFQEHLPDP